MGQGLGVVHRNGTTHLFCEAIAILGNGDVTNDHLCPKQNKGEKITIVFSPLFLFCTKCAYH